MDPSEKMVSRYRSDERTKRVLDDAMAVENLGRNLGVHACGIIIAPGPVHDYVPVCAVKGKPATQFNMNQVESCGLLKMDFLGLKTMSILKKACDIVQQRSGEEIVLDRIPLDDVATFKLLSEGDTLGVFQCESSGFRELIRQMKPDRFEDMIALVALYRPGPLGANMHIDYCERKHGRQAVDYPHPVLQGVLEETYGLYIYQEQVMNIARELCGFSPADADDLRKAMGKKQLDVLAKHREHFINGAWERHRFDRERCAAMWDNILGFASYGFNKSHSACYGLIAYWTAWMKANHHAAFMTANLIYEMGNKDKMTLFIQELKTRRIAVLPPDVNESGWEFTWTGEAVRFGFGGVKGIGEGAAEHLIAMRRDGGHFAGLHNLCERVDTRVVNKRVVEHLIKVGAFDRLHGNRAACLLAMDAAFERGHRLGKARNQNQTSLFGTFERDEDFRAQTQGLPDVPEWPEAERLAFEKQLTGYWMSSHPVTGAADRLGPFATHSASELSERPSGTIAIAAVVVAKREVRTKAGKRMAVLQLEDEAGRFEAVLFPGRQDRRGGEEPGAYDRFSAECEPDLVALFVGDVDRRERRGAARRQAAQHDDEDGEPAAPADDSDESAPNDQLPPLIISDVIPADRLEERLTRELILAVDGEDTEMAAKVDRSAVLLAEHQGECPLRLCVQTAQEVLVTLIAGDRWRVHVSRSLIEQLGAIWGEGAVRAQMRHPAERGRSRHAEPEPEEAWV